MLSLNHAQCYKVILTDHSDFCIRNRIFKTRFSVLSLSLVQGLFSGYIRDPFVSDQFADRCSK